MSFGKVFRRKPAPVAQKPPMTAAVQPKEQDLTMRSTMRGGLERARRRGTQFASVIDVGASDGRWTRQCLKHFPDARYLLFEALATHEPELQTLQSEYPGVEYVLVAVGDREGHVHFQVTADPFGGAASHEAISESDIVVRMTTLDHEIARRQLPPPYLVKLDTHGFERQIFEGATETLKHTELIVVEAYNIELQRPEPTFRFHELCAYMEARGLRCADLVEPLYRPKDFMLWQVDLFFIPATRAEFQDNGFD